MPRKRQELTTVHYNRRLLQTMQETASANPQLSVPSPVPTSGADLQLLGVPEAAFERLHLRYVPAQTAVDAAAVVTDQDAAVYRRPRRLCEAARTHTQSL